MEIRRCAGALIGSSTDGVADSVSPDLRPPCGGALARLAGTVINAAPFDGLGRISVSDSLARRTVEVRVELKPGIFDAEAESITKSLRLLGIPHLGGVSTGRVYTLLFDGVSPEEASKLATRAVEELLANPVIHRVVVGPPTG
jgi:phosphoribosylformylglycinamidine synthase PurS subunit